MGGTIMNGETTLEQDMALARSATKSERINHRDRVARHGEAAIDAVAGWLTDREMCFFAVRVIWKAGEQGARSKAIATLREALDDPTVAADRDDIALHLRYLGYLVPTPPDSGSKPTRIPAVAGTGWPGFQPREFETVDGTHWRSRTGKDSLIPHLMRPLREVDPRLDSWPIYHSPEIHIAARDRYIQFGDPKQGFRAAKLIVYAHGITPTDSGVGSQVAVGLYVEKGDGKGVFGPVDSRWDWPPFIRCMRQEPFLALLERAMVMHDLTMGDYVGGAWDGDWGVGFRARVHAGEPLVVLRDGSERRGWLTIVELLEALPQDRWHNLHIWRSWPDTEAMDAGVSFARSAMVPVLRDLARLYVEVVPPA
jgi:hypothetical protein